jgi:hypothetical protein
MPPATPSALNAAAAGHSCRCGLAWACHCLDDLIDLVDGGGLLSDLVIIVCGVHSTPSAGTLQHVLFDGMAQHI